MIKRQLELGFGQERGFARPPSSAPAGSFNRQRRPTRAQWWFQRMREIVDQSQGGEMQPATGEHR